MSEQMFVKPVAYFAQDARGKGLERMREQASAASRIACGRRMSQQVQGDDSVATMPTRPYFATQDGGKQQAEPVQNVKPVQLAKNEVLMLDRSGREAVYYRDPKSGDYLFERHLDSK